MHKSDVKAPADAAKALGMALPRYFCDGQAGLRILQRRKQLKISRRALAGACHDVSYNDLREIEDSVRRPTLDELFRLAPVLLASEIYLAWGRKGIDPGARETRYLLLFSGIEEERLDAALAKHRELKKLHGHRR